MPPAADKGKESGVVENACAVHVVNEVCAAAGDGLGEGRRDG